MTRAAAKNPFKTVHEDAEHIKQAGSHLVEDVEHIGSAVQGLAEDSWKLFKGTVAGYYDRFEDRLKTRVKNQPMKSLLMAAGIGFLVGWLKR